MEENTQPQFIFKCLEKGEINECSELIAHIFSLYDPFLFHLKITKEDLIQIVKNDLNTIVDDQLVTIIQDVKNGNKIVGSYAGFKLSRLYNLSSEKNSDFFSLETKKVLRYPKNVEKIDIDKKLSILDEIDYHLLKPRYVEHKTKNELNEAIFCDYYCVSDEYFQSNLAKELALNFFKNCKEQGINHIYGSFFNIKAIKLLTKYFPANIVNEIKVIFNDEEVEGKNESEKDEYTIYLLHGKNDEKNLNPKF
jgi:hypothetical protein